MTNITKVEAISEYFAENGFRFQPTVTIFYIEDADPDTWKPKPNTPDAWNDVSCLGYKLGTSEAKLIMSSYATTEPGRKMVENPMNSAGAFRIQLDKQFRECWEVGRHITTHSNQLALVQCDDVSGHRDFNKDFMRVGDKLHTGMFGINQHTTGNSADSPPPDKVGGQSAGCLVRRYPSTHYNIFMPALQESGQKKFDTVVIDGSKLDNWLTNKNYILV
jgi:hypothetical protein